MLSDEQLKKVKALLFDVDGVLTDGRAGYGAPDLIKFFNFKDGLWMRMAMRAGLIVGMFSGKESNANKTRAAELGLSFCYEGMKDKLAGFERFLEEFGVQPEECLFAGDDLIDLPVLRRVGVAVTPADGIPEVDEAVHWRTTAMGGHGVACEIVRRVLTAQNKLDEEMKRYRK